MEIIDHGPVRPPYGSAICTRHEDGTVTVDHADEIVQATAELLDAAEPWAWDGETLQLDTAGEYRYRPIGEVRATGYRLFERIKPGAEAQTTFIGPTT